MDNQSKNQIRMIRTTLENLNDYIVKWTGFVPVEKYVALITANVAKIDVQEDKIASIDGGPSKRKEILRQQMQQTSMKISGSAYAYADDIGDTILLSKMDISKSDFTYLSDGEQANKAEMIYNETHPIVTSLSDYKILPADITELQKRIKDYRDFLTAPKISINIGSEAREEIKKLIKAILRVLIKLDKLMEHFREDEHEFFELYFKSRMVIDLGHRYRKAISKITGKVIDFESEAIVANANVYFEGEEKNLIKSDENGLYAIGAFKEGELVLIAVKEGFKKCEEMLTIKKDEDQELNLELEKVETPIIPPEV